MTNDDKTKKEVEPKPTPVDRRLTQLDPEKAKKFIAGFKGVN